MVLIRWLKKRSQWLINEAFACESKKDGWWTNGVGWLLQPAIYTKGSVYVSLAWPIVKQSVSGAICLSTRCRFMKVRTIACSSKQARVSNSSFKKWFVSNPFLFHFRTAPVGIVEEFRWKFLKNSCLSSSFNDMMFDIYATLMPPFFLLLGLFKRLSDLIKELNQQTNVARFEKWQARSLTNHLDRYPLAGQSISVI